MNILLLEPDVVLAGTYAAALGQHKHAVAVAHQAQMAIHAADEQAPDLVIAELQIPGHNGVEFLYEFRSYSEWQHIPVMLLTMVPAHSLLITQAMMDRFGIVDILYKPATSLQTLKLAAANAARATTAGSAVG